MYDLKKGNFAVYNYRAYKVRKYLAAVHWNYHLHLSIATKKTGEQLFSGEPDNQRIGQWDMKIVKADKGYEYIPLLITKIFHTRMPGC